MLAFYLIIRKDGYYIEKSKTEIRLPATVSSEYEALSDEIILYILSMELVLSNFGKIELDTILESRLVLDGESLQHDSHRNFITDTLPDDKDLCSCARYVPLCPRSTRSSLYIPISGCQPNDGLRAVEGSGTLDVYAKGKGAIAGHVCEHEGRRH